jgi:hypothetical protein
MNASQPSIEQLVCRLEQLELRHRRLKLWFGAAVLVAIGCGAADTTARYKKVTSHDIAIFGAEEEGEVITLDRTAQGGRLIVRDAAGRVRVEIDEAGLRTRDASGTERWTSPP